VHGVVRSHRAAVFLSDWREKENVVSPGEETDTDVRAGQIDERAGGLTDGRIGKQTDRQTGTDR